VGRYARVPHLSALEWIQGYPISTWLRGDILAGLTASALVIPQAMAYASLAGLPVQVGLYAAFTPAIAYALLGTSRCLSVSVTSTVSLMTAVTIAALPPERQIAGAAALALLVGAVLILAGILRLGMVSHFISEPVLVGFKIGAGLLVASSQLGKIFGIPVPRGNFFPQVIEAIKHLDETNWWTFSLAAATVAIMLGLKRFAPSIPGGLVAFAFGIVVMEVSNLSDRGVATVGDIPSGLPSFSWPGLSDTNGMIPAALGIALMAFVESISASRAFVRTDEPRIDSNQELVALGAASLTAGLFQGYPTSGGLSQTAINRSAGARTPMAIVVTVGVVGLALTVLTPLFSHLAEATLGGLVLVAAIGLVDIKGLKKIAAVNRQDAIFALVAAAGVLLFGVLQGVLLGVITSMLVLIYHSANTRLEVLGRAEAEGRWRAVSRNPQAIQEPGLLVVRPQGGLYFANGEHVTDAIRAAVDARDEPPSVVIIDGGAVHGIEYSAVAVLDLLQNELKRDGIELWGANFTHFSVEVIERAQRHGLLESFETYQTVEAAIRAAK
jgi:high affinity sulfate transporter 1